MSQTLAQPVSVPASRWLLDIPEAQRELHLSRAAVFRLVAGGALGSIKVERRRLIPVRELEAFIAHQCGEGGVA